MSQDGTVVAPTKSISRFLPVTTHPVEESERHYTQVHFPWAQRMLRERPQVLTYHTNRVMRQYDLLGRWGQRPTAWRFVLLTFEAGRSLELDRRTAEAIARDHPNCLRDLRATPVEESVVLDHRSGQTVLAKYLIEIDRADATAAHLADERVTVFVDGVASAAATSDGFRLLRVNRVLGEAETGPVVEPGQRMTGRLLSSTTKTAYVEIYFDDASAGDEFFCRKEIRALFDDDAFQTLAAYHVEERCGLDRR